MSGPYALAAAARYPDRIAAAASFYGTWLVSDAEESPHRSLSQVKGELYIACAEHDALAPMPMVEELQGLFTQPDDGLCVLAPESVLDTSIRH
jgi:carboxymethylenebutenolidase